MRDPEDVSVFIWFPVNSRRNGNVQVAGLRWASLCIVNAMRLFWVGACCVNVAGTAEVPISHPSVASCLDKLIGKRKDSNS